MTKIKLIALDLDGTTLNEKSQLTLRTKEVLECALEQGLYVVAASGRAFASFPKEVLDIRGLTAAITSNGAATCEPLTGKRIASISMESEKVDAVLGMLKEEPFREIEVFHKGVAYVSQRYFDNPVSAGAPQRIIPYIKSTRHPVPDIRKFLMEHRDELDSMDIICGDERDKKRWKRQLEELGGLYITSSVFYRIEISNEQCGKGNALRKVAELLQVHPEEIIAFGNAQNDMDMLRFAGTSVAVANSEPEVLQYADIIAPSNDEDGVAQVLEQFLEGSFG